jgi:hypothetical protein
MKIFNHKTHGKLDLITTLQHAIRSGYKPQIIINGEYYEVEE